MLFKYILIAAASTFLLSGANALGQSGLTDRKTAIPKFIWQKLETGTDASFRGLSIVSDDAFWVSGSKGTVIRTIDGGKTFQDVSVPAGSEHDFRDIHAFHTSTAVILNAGFPGEIYRTSDGGKNWAIVYNDTREEIFFDALDFWDDQHGVAFGDPIDGRLVILLTDDGGKSWKELDRDLQPKMHNGEAGFAASGSCIAAVRKETILIGTGGHLEGQSHPFSRLLISSDRDNTWTSRQAPMLRNQSSGIFSICLTESNQLIVVGGDYTQPDLSSGNCAFSMDDGRTWTSIIKQPPSGFRSVVTSAKINNRLTMVAAGTNGIDISSDQGSSWKRISNITVNALAFSKNRKSLVTAGPKGSVYLGTPSF